MIYLDFDGVIADLSTEWFRRFNERHGTDLDWRQATNWTLKELIPDEHRGEFYAILDEPDLYEGVKPIDGALETIWWLDGAGVPWSIASTCTSPTMVNAKVDWIYRHDLARGKRGRWPDNFIAISDKSLLRGAALVDDGPHNLANFKGHKFLFDQPYNRGIPRFAVTRVEGWVDVGRHLLNIEPLSEVA